MSARRAARGKLVVLAGLALAVAAAGGCGGGGAGGRVLLLVTIDTLRADRLGAGGDPHARTPHLDRAVRRGTQWARAVSPVPLTLPAHATILSGRTPPDHGARDNGLYRVDDDIPLVPETLARTGWRTAAFLAAYPLASRFGLARGFAAYHDALGLRDEGSGSSFAERPAHKVNDDVFSWLDARGRDDRPLFLWVHYFDPHAPYAPPRVWTLGVGGDPYRGEVAFTDDRLGRLLSRLQGAFDRVDLLVVGDHGESLGEHDEDTHGVFVYEATTRVPLLAQGPGVPAGRLRGHAVSIDRVASTLLELAGVADADGTFPVPSLLGEDFEGDPVYVESMYPRLRHGWAPLAGWRTDRWKVIRAPRPEVYDLVRDPGERRNLFGAGRVPPEAEQLLATLDAFPLEPELPAAVDPEVEEALRSLGYAGAAKAPPPPGELPDPKDRVALERALGQAGGALEAGRLDAARAAVGRALAVEPRNKETLILSARIAAAEGAVDDALATLDRCRALPPASANALVEYTAGEIALAAGRPAGAETHFGAAVQMDPLNVDARYNWGLAAYRREDWAAAADRWRAALALDPQHPLAGRWLPDAEKRRDAKEER